MTYIIVCIAGGAVYYYYSMMVPPPAEAEAMEPPGPPPGESPETLARKAEEAKAILAAIEEAKVDVKNEIESKRESDPEEAYKLAKAYVATFPAEGPELKAQLPDMAAKVKERTAEK